MELADWAEPYLVDEPVMDPKAVKKFLGPAQVPVLERVAALVKAKGTGDPEALEAGVRDIAEQMELKLGGVAQPVRVALTGRTFSPGIFEVMAILGDERVKARLTRALGLAAK